MKKITGTLLAASLLVTGALAGCGGKEEPKAAQGTTAPEKKEAPTEISIMTTFYTQEPPAEDNVIWKEIEKRTNTKLKITWVPNATYNEKVNVTLASGEIPDLTLLLDPLTPQVRRMAQEGAFWDLTNEIKNYKNLMQFPQESWTNTKMADGKSYLIPRVRPVEGADNLMVREDWLKKFNVKMPESLDEIYGAMKTISEKDPDGNGKADTVGFAGFVGADNMGNLKVFENTINGSKDRWKLVDGKIVDSYMEPSEKEALAFLNKLYKEKLIPQDFAILKANQVQDLLKGNKAVFGYGAINSSWTDGDAARKVDPAASLVSFPYIAGPKGKYAARGDGYFGAYLIPKKVSEAKMKKILEFLNYGASEEGYDLAVNGLPTTHYEVKDGFKVQNEQAKKDNVSVNAFGQVYSKYDKYFRAYAPGIPAAVFEANKKIVDAAAAVSISNPQAGLNSDTYNKVGKDMDKKIQDMKTKVIMGDASLADWDAFAAKMKADADYQKIVAEYNEAHKKRSGK